MLRTLIVLGAVSILCFVFLFESPSSTFLLHPPPLVNEESTPAQTSPAAKHRARRRQPLQPRDWQHRVSCHDFSPSANGTLKLLGDASRNYSGNHFCVLRDVVIDGRTSIWRPSSPIHGALQIYLRRPLENVGEDGGAAVFRSPRRREINGFPFALFSNQRFSTRIAEFEDASGDDNESEMLHAKFPGATVLGTALFLPLSYDFSHPSHALENLGSLVERFLMRQTQQQQQPWPERVILPQRAPAKRGTLQHTAVSCVTNQTNIDIVGVGNEVLIVKELMVPGSAYDLFSNGAQAAAFSALQKRCLPQRSAEKRGKMKKIVFLRRDPNSRRKLLGLENFVSRLRRKITADDEILIHFADPYLFKHAINELHAQIHDADVLVGIHGADLTNMLLLAQPHVKIVEIFPFLFAEPRFRSLAHLLFGDSSYQAVNCVSSRCAFGGDAGKMRQVLQASGVTSFDDATSTLNYKNEQDDEMSVQWPAVGYPASFAVIAQTGLERIFLSTLREADVNLGSDEKMSRALTEVLFDAVGLKR